MARSDWARRGSGGKVVNHQPPKSSILGRPSEVGKGKEGDGVEGEGEEGPGGGEEKGLGEELPVDGRDVLESAPEIERAREIRPRLGEQEGQPEEQLDGRADGEGHEGAQQAEGADEQEEQRGGVQEHAHLDGNREREEDAPSVPSLSEEQKHRQEQKPNGPAVVE